MDIGNFVSDYLSNNMECIKNVNHLNLGLVADVSEIQAVYNNKELYTHFTLPYDESKGYYEFAAEVDEKLLKEYCDALDNKEIVKVDFVLTTHLCEYSNMYNTVWIKDIIANLKNPENINFQIPKERIYTHLYNDERIQ